MDLSRLVPSFSLRITLTLAFMAPLFVAAQELCANAIDDDADGLIDLNDPDCPCSAVIIPAGTPSYIQNHSFEDRVVGENGPCCPYGFSTLGINWLACAQNWNQATSATSDYFNMCGFAPPSFPMPPPDGDAAIGFISTTTYKEYVGSCIFDNPMYAGTEYTLSLWTAGLSISETNFAGAPLNIGVFYEGVYPLTLWGRTNCVPMPIATMECIGFEDGWVELARVEYQPDNGWLHVSMTFMPSQEIRMIMLGAPCDLPATFVPTAGMIDTDQGPVPMNFYPYNMADDLLLTAAVDQVLTPVTSTGRVCSNNVVVTAMPPAGATGHQWYVDGVAIVGQTSTTLNASALGLAGGLYTLSSSFEGQCLMGNTSVWSPDIPEPAFVIAPASGCAPLTVFFSDTTGRGTSTISWDFGDGAIGTGTTAVHTYTTEGSYDVTLTISTAEGCLTDITVLDAVVVAGQLSGVLSATPNPTDVENTAVALSASGSSGDIVSWSWDLGNVPPGTSVAESLTVDFPAEPGSYPVLLVVRTIAGCVDTVRSEIVITLNGVIEMPNIFSPNGDGHNDRFLPLNYDGTPGLLEVFNRWGQLVFSTSSLQQGWPGNDMPDGTYYYVVAPTDPKAETRTGHVTLVR